ncbi:hypothetical protein J437_LFUL006383 [Ladona fulva]|uniref:Reverse transcriptase domain-containing protein n=1 Tax=Ladona fulva TaxID=123851 RepID=A0A8K0K1C7_LADFU|nr:hypothetical protein J437_LFUL006383 [Ladona fulva]
MKTMLPRVTPLPAEADDGFRIHTYSARVRMMETLTNSSGDRKGEAGRRVVPAAAISAALKSEHTYFPVYSHCRESEMDCKCCLERHRVEPTDSRAIVLLSYCISKGDIHRIINGYDNCGNVCGKITVSEVNHTEESCKGADHTNKSWSAGFDEIPIIKQAAYSIASPISSIFNSSTNEGHFHSSLKLAYVAAVHKNGLIALEPWILKLEIGDTTTALPDLSIYPQLSREFSIKKGVKQGDSLSPLLFINFMDEIAKNCKQKTAKTQIGFWNLNPVHIQVLLYADDIVLIADSEEKLQNCVTEWGDELTRKEIVIHVKKSKTIIFLVLFGMRKRIKLVIIIIKEAGAAIYSMPLLLIQPLISYCLIAMIFTLWLYFTLWIESAGTLSKVSNKNYRFLKDDKIKLTKEYLFE